MSKGGLLAIGLLGGLALLGSAAKAGTRPAPQAPPGPPPPFPPPATPPTPAAHSNPAPRKPVPVTKPPEETPLPAGWIPARPTPTLSSAARDMAQLGNAPGTIYPFELDGKKYAALVLQDRSVAVLQPEDQI